MNFVLFDKRGALEFDEKQVLLERLATAMDKRVDEANATACSRLAWLYVRLKVSGRAADLVKRGLELEPDNEYCLRLFERLTAN